MFRGSTAALVYTKALSADADHNQLAAVTLMSTDIDRIGTSKDHCCSSTSTH